MYYLFQGIKSLLKLEEIRTDNNIFRLHYKVTTIILISLSLITTSRQYIGDPITCINEGMAKNIMDSYCWITSTFSVKKDVSEDFGRLGQDLVYPGVGPYVETRDEVKHHKYYQWVCFVLFFQAVLFYIPRYVWKVWEGGRAKKLATNLKLISLDNQAMNQRCESLCEYFEKNLNHHNLYLIRFTFCEILNFVNVIGQMFLMDWFLGYEFSSYGWRVLKFTEMEHYERMDPMSEIFPKLAKCTFKKYGPSGTIEVRDTLCVLPLNVVNEKTYVFLWFWFIFLAIITGLSLVYRFSTIISRRFRYVLLKSRFRIASAADVKYLCSKFKAGDWFMFYLLSTNIDSFACKKIITDLARCMRRKDFENLPHSILDKFDLESNDIKKV